MKKTGLFFVFILTLSQLLQSQNVPSAFNYSAVARDAQSNPISNQTIGIQISILKSSPTGTVVFQENHFVNTNQSGLFNLMIGTGSVLNSSIPSIDWGNDDYYIKVGMDVTGGTNFLEMGTTQLLSVPYALYAKSSGNRLIVSNTGDTLRLSGSNYVIIPGISAANSGSIGDDLDDTDDTDSNDNNTDNSTYTIPSTYNFPNVNYSGQTDRLDMLSLLVDEVKMSHAEGYTVDAQTLNEMYSNEYGAGTFGSEIGTGGQLVGSTGKDLKNKTYQYTQASIVSLFDSIAKYSGKLGGANGQAGLVARGDQYILVDATGKEYAQLIDKGLMGSCFYYQGTTKYLSDDKIGDAVDNETVEPGKGTAKEHHFDEAFGYFGVPIDFPTNTNYVRFWGKYCNKRDDILGTNAIMEEFLKGRAAISAKDKEGQDSAVAEIKVLWEKVVAGTAINYLNHGIANFSDDGNRLHYLTEAYAFIQALAYNADGTVSLSDSQEILNALGDNFWTVTINDITTARDLLAAKAGLESVKTQL